MDVSLVLIVVMAVLFACGVYAMLERSLTRVLIGFLLLGNATNLLLLIVMGQPGVAPFFGAAASVRRDVRPAAAGAHPHRDRHHLRASRRSCSRSSTARGSSARPTPSRTTRPTSRCASAARSPRTRWTTRPSSSATTRRPTSSGSTTAPITVLGSRDFAGIRDDAPTDRPAPDAAKSRRAASDRRRTVTTRERPRPAAGHPAAPRRGDRPHRRPAPQDAGRRLGRDPHGRAA